MRHDKASQETTCNTILIMKTISCSSTCCQRTENWVHSNNVSEESRNEDDEQCERHHGSRWLSCLQTTRPHRQPFVCPSYGIQHEQDEPNTGKQHIQRSDTVAGVHECHSQCKENPANDIITHTSGEGDNSDSGIQKLRFGENTAQDRERGDSDCNSREQDEVTEVHVRLNELSVNANTQGCTHSEGYDQSGHRNSHGRLDISFDDTDVDLKADEEQKDNKAECTCQGKNRDRRIRENSSCEACHQKSFSWHK